MIEPIKTPKLTPGHRCNPKRRTSAGGTSKHGQIFRSPEKACPTDRCALSPAATLPWCTSSRNVQGEYGASSGILLMGHAEMANLTCPKCGCPVAGTSLIRTPRGAVPTGRSCSCLYGDGSTAAVEPALGSIPLP